MPWRKLKFISNDWNRCVLDECERTTQCFYCQFLCTKTNGLQTEKKKKVDNRNKNPG